MSIGKRLIILFIMIFALVGVSAFLMYQGRPVIVAAFQRSRDALDSLTSIRELRSHINSQRVSLSRYLSIDEGQELINYDESCQLAQKNIDKLKSQFRDQPPLWLMELNQMYTEAQTLATRVINLYKRDAKTVAHEEYLSKLGPLYKKLSDRVAAIENDKKSEADATFQTVRVIMDKAGNWIVILFFVALISGIVILVSLYRAVMIPLEILRRGTDEFGKGHWDHRIDLPTHNEFGVLAKSFNVMAENVKQLQLQTAHLDRMSAVGQLAGGVAHEINNPLTAILGQAQILLAKMAESDPIYGALKKIENAGLRCRKIVRGLLDFSRPTQTSFEMVDINEIIKSTLDLCEADIKRHQVLVHRQFAPSLPKIQANSSELQQVLINLINNAIQAMPKGGGLTIETQTHKRPLTLMERRKGALPRTLEGPWVEVRITDTGIGIAEDYLTKIFEPFFTTKEIGQGTGLGLAVSMGIVQKHGGDLRAESAGINRGATFIVTLPLKQSRSTGLAINRTPGFPQ